MNRWLLILAVSLALAGCGGTDETAAETASAPASAELPPGTPADPLPGTATAPPDPLFNATTPEEAPRVTIDQIAPRLGGNEVVLLDVRSETAWAIEHADGAVHIPLEQVGMRAGELPKSKLIVAYCT